jgi:transcriptional regulator with XRE-family HTH domain
MNDCTFTEHMPSHKPSALASTSSPDAHRLDLARFRKQVGVSLEDIASETKISMRFLRAIEEEQFDKLPGGIFNTSYLRQYAAAIGYDESELLVHYHRATNPPAAGLKARSNASGNQGFLYRWLKVPAEAQR